MPSSYHRPDDVVGKTREEIGRGSLDDAALAAAHGRPARPPAIQELSLPINSGDGETAGSASAACRSFAGDGRFWRLPRHRVGRHRRGAARTGTARGQGAGGTGARRSQAGADQPGARGKAGAARSAGRRHRARDQEPAEFRQQLCRPVDRTPRRDEGRAGGLARRPAMPTSAPTSTTCSRRWPAISGRSASTATVPTASSRACWRIRARARARSGRPTSTR